MKFLSLAPTLYTDSVQKTIDFYVETLHFTTENKTEDATWAYVNRDGVSFMISEPNVHTPFNKPAFTGSFYITVDNVDALWEELKDKVTVSYPPENFDYGMREFAIHDNNGYVLQFGQEIEEKTS